MDKAALLVLEDGTQWPGVPLGARGERTGEVVFNTSMTGYQEVLSDPSYFGQMVVMTVSHVGNTGVNTQDDESARAWLSGFAVREASRRVSSWRAHQSLDDYLRERGVVGIAQIDTRALVRHIRSQGTMRGALANDNPDSTHLFHAARQMSTMSGLNLVDAVTSDELYHWDEPTEPNWYSFAGQTVSNGTGLHVVALDYGIKRNILRLLTTRGCRVTVVPANLSARDLLALQPDGIVLSNGPGDPAAVSYAIQATRDLVGRVPIFGICLGHQILGLALGGETYKLKFGHRGINQPVKNLVTGQVEITTHNHGFAVRAEGLPKDVEVTHINLNDQCIEGLQTRKRSAFSVQYHPEASPGPHDAIQVFDQFIAWMGH